MFGAFDLNATGAFASVVLIDLALAGDNALIVGLAAARLPVEQRRRAIWLGIGIATVLRIALASIALRLLAIIGLTLAGGIILLWVVWKFYRDLNNDALSVGISENQAAPTSFSGAIWRLVAADLSMSLDNVLAVAGAARDHFWVLAAGLMLSVGLMGLASTLVTRLLARYQWVAWLGLAVVAFVALRMIYDGSIEVWTSVASWQQ